MKIGDKVIIVSFNNFPGVIEQIFDDGFILVDMRTAFTSHVDPRSVLKLCVSEKDLKFPDEWSDLWEQN